MSRVVVKNLPKHATDASCKEFFSSQGLTVTDSKVLMDRDSGRSRRTAFLGFRTEAEAQQALKFFNNTFMGTSKIIVQVAKPIGSEELVKHAKKRTPPPKQPLVPKVHSSKHEEFLKVMRPHKQLRVEEETDDEEDNNDKEEMVAPNDDTTTTVLESTHNSRLFVRNLPYTCTKDDLIAFFQGLPTEVILPLDEYQKPKGFAILSFSSPAIAEEMLQSKNQTSFQGRLIFILPAQEQQQQHHQGNAPPVNPSMSYKSQREEERRKLAGGEEDVKAWHALFLRGDAAAGVMAANLQISKRELLLGGEDEDDAAIRVAMSEAKVIEENKQFLESQGVDLLKLQQCLKNKKAIPSCILLAKNLPEGANEAELRTLFAKQGTLSRFVMPPSRTVALAVYNEIKDAKRAMQSLAYSRFKSAPLYLQYADDSLVLLTTASKQQQQKQPSEVIVEEEEEDLSTRSCVLFCKNLSFLAREDDVMAHAKSLGLLPKSCKIPMRPGKQEKEVLSSGFGFLEFSTPQQAISAQRVLHQSELMGHVLHVEFQQRKSTKPILGEAGTSKLVVRNLAFECTKKELVKLFSSVAEVKSVRLPKKMDGTIRGFAFVEFPSIAHAKLAKQALESAHLYGRRLVVEYASNTLEEEDDQTMLRQRMRE